MRVNVVLVGYLELIGLPGGFTGGPVELTDGARVSDLLRLIGVDLPTLNFIVRQGQIVNLDDLLCEGDRISVVPPIGGGSQ